MALFLSQSHEYQPLCTEPSLKLSSHSYDLDGEIMHCEVMMFALIL